MLLKQSSNGKIRIVGNEKNDPDGHMENLELQMDVPSGDTVHIGVTGLAAGWNHGFDTNGCWIALSLFGMPKAFNDQQKVADYVWQHRHEVIAQVMN